MVSTFDLGYLPAMSNDPFQGPNAELGRHAVTSSSGLHVNCPKCSAADPEALGFTWWGGMIGAKLITHVKCTQCRYTYNGKTGASNTPKIVIYQVVLFAIAFVVYATFS